MGGNRTRRTGRLVRFLHDRHGLVNFGEPLSRQQEWGRSENLTDPIPERNRGVVSRSLSLHKHLFATATGVTQAEDENGIAVILSGGVDNEHEVAGCCAAITRH